MEYVNYALLHPDEDLREKEESNKKEEAGERNTCLSSIWQGVEDQARARARAHLYTCKTILSSGFVPNKPSILSAGRETRPRVRATYYEKERGGSERKVNGEQRVPRTRARFDTLLAHLYLSLYIWQQRRAREREKKMRRGNATVT